MNNKQLNETMKHMYIMADVMKSSSISTTVTQICFQIKIMKSKLNSQNISGNLNVMVLSSIKIEHCWVCYTIQVWHKKMRPLTDIEYITARANQYNLLDKRTELTCNRM